MPIASPHMTLSCLLRHPANEAPKYSDGCLRERAQSDTLHSWGHRCREARSPSLRALR
jgi:hypothetical protein